MKVIYLVVDEYGNVFDAYTNREDAMSEVENAPADSKVIAVTLHE